MVKCLVRVGRWRPNPWRRKEEEGNVVQLSEACGGFCEFGSRISIREMEGGS